MPARLKVVKGDKAGTVYELDGELFVGRDPGNDIAVLDHTASRHHVKISVVNGQVLVKDLGSNNGTFVNGVRVTETVLKENDKVLIGSTLFVFESGAETQSPEPARQSRPQERTVISSIAFSPKRAVAQVPPRRSGGSRFGGTSLPASCNVEEVRLVGNSPSFRRAVELAAAAAAASSPVLLLGASGTGKEILARFIHATSGRREGPFVALNCAAFPETLLESELFGHAKGAFTGADSGQPGKFELAQSGTLFLDEIADCSPALQAKLLRAVEEKEFFPVGSNKARHVDARIVAATNKNLQKAMEEGSFRPDLYYRLNVIAIELPALRERAEDLPFLAYHFLEESNFEAKKTIKGIAGEALDALGRYSWPGNVRELRNVIERAVVLCRRDSIGPEDLPPEIGGLRKEPAAQVQSAGQAGNGIMTINEAEKELIARTLRHTGGKKGEAAKLLGISWPTLNKKIADYGIEV